MSDISINQLLDQMKVIRNQSTEVFKPDETKDTDFTKIMTDAVNTVNENQVKASELKSGYEMGDKNISLAEVMIAGQKAGVSFQAMVQVRNKLVSAYQEIMNMPV